MICEYGQTPLHYAAEYGETEVARLLLDAKANADAKDVCETDARLFVIRDIDSSNTCHEVPFRFGSWNWSGSGWMVFGLSGGFNASLNFG